MRMYQYDCLLIPGILHQVSSDIYLSGTEGGLRNYWSLTPSNRTLARSFLIALSCLSFLQRYSFGCAMGRDEDFGTASHLLATGFIVFNYRLSRQRIN
ncbi:hypothetical protein M405DRAFT_287529 [Rhizopogon salebrosus TDB-379]|nr:hypothetical protein M405DRAFT_287529 [Rhizopogon salebrosus TDB-379]